MSTKSEFPIFDLEQRIMECWNMVDDINMIYYHLGDNPKFSGMKPEAEDEMSNLLLGMHSLYQLKFQRMWDTFEIVCREHHKMRKELDGNHDDN